MKIKKQDNTKAKNVTVKKQDDSLKFIESKQIYRLFKATDYDEYRRQSVHGITCCALRSGLTAESKTSMTGTNIMLITNAAQGVAAFMGKKLDETSIGCGKFVFRALKNAKIKWLGGITQLAQLLKREGEAVKIGGKAAKALAGSKYSFYTLDGKIVKTHESGTCSRGKANFASWE